jgi:hypothetical protein
MRWKIANGPSDTCESGKSTCLYINVNDGAPSDVELLYKKYGFAMHKNKKHLTLDLDALLTESEKIVKLESTIESLVRTISEIQSRLVKIDGARLCAAIDAKNGEVK